MAGNARTFTKLGAGTLVLSGSSANTNTGLVTVQAGALHLNKTSGNAVAGNLTIGTTGGSNAVTTAKLLRTNQIVDTATVTVIGSSSTYRGLFDLNGLNETIGTLSMQGGGLSTGAGVLTVSTDYTNTYFGSGNSFNAKQTGTGSSITGTINAPATAIRPS